jgi:hypothetical protein
MVDRALAHPGQRPHVGNGFGKGNGCRQQVGAGIEHAVEQRCAGQFVGQDRRAGEDHVQRGFKAQHARQALRAARAWQQAQLDFGQRDLRAARRHPVVAAQRQLKAAAHAHAVDGRDNRLDRAFGDGDQGVQRRFGKGLGRIEFTDVGAAREHLAGARDDDRRDCRVGLGLPDARNKGSAGGQAKAIDGRVVQRDDGNAAVDLIVGAHVGYVSF